VPTLRTVQSESDRVKAVNWWWAKQREVEEQRTLARALPAGFSDWPRPKRAYEWNVTAGSRHLTPALVSLGWRAVFRQLPVSSLYTAIRAREHRRSRNSTIDGLREWKKPPEDDAEGDLPRMIR